MLNITLSQKKKIVKYFERFKSNLSIILIVPTVFGGAIQSFQLAIISPALLRFFSFSQLIADGLFLFSLIFFIIIIPYQLAVFLHYLVQQLIAKYKRIIIRCLTIVILLFGIFLILGAHSKSEDYLGMIFISYMIVMTSFFTIIRNIDSRPTPMISIEKKLNNSFNLSIIIMAIIFSGLFFQILSIKTPIDNFDKLREKYSKKEKVKVLYFNDKYVFIKIVSGKEKGKIHIEKIDSLFN